mmetsp:Transcript_32093/g.91556  ORF Transcript_32093/g.91556 Transcript_32093/m.91556 type:complete len:345 (-) Transcript_32093:162-1196(-)
MNTLSFIQSPFVVPHNDGADEPSDKRLRKSGTQLSLAALLSPLSTQAHRDPLGGECGFDSSDDAREKTSETSRSSEQQRPVMVVAPEHNRVRTIIRGRRETRESASGLQTDPHRLPLKFEGKFRMPENSHDARLPGPRGGTRTKNTRVAPEASSSAKILAPFGESAHSHLDVSSSSRNLHKQPQHHQAFSQQTSHAATTTHNNNNTMSSPATNTVTKSPQGRRSSRSIAIKSHNHQHPTTGYLDFPGNATSASQSELLAAEEDSASNERMYDWATWRMYNRIVDHRRNQQLSSSGTSSSSVSSHGGGGVMADPSLYSLLGGSMNMPLQDPADYLHEGEVFELEF